MDGLPDFVRQSRLVTPRCDGGVTIHELHDGSAATPGSPPTPRQERWERIPPPWGEGILGKVWLEGRRDDPGGLPTVFRAVKEIRIAHPRLKPSDYCYELEAIMKFSQQKVIETNANGRTEGGR